MFGRLRERSERLRQRRKESLALPVRLLRQTHPKHALPQVIGMGFQPTALIERFGPLRHKFSVNAEPVEKPVDTVRRIGDEYARNVSRERKDLFARTPLQVALETARRIGLAHRRAKAPRSLFAKNAPNHPVGFVADDVRERLLRKEPHPLR